MFMLFPDSSTEPEGTTTMKRLLSIILATALAGGTAAYAGPHGHGGYHGHPGYHHRHHGDDGAAIAAGLGALALFAIIASQDRQDNPPPPPPPPPENAYPPDYQGPPPADQGYQGDQYQGDQGYQGNQYGAPQDGANYGDDGDQQ